MGDTFAAVLRKTLGPVLASIPLHHPALAAFGSTDAAIRAAVQHASRMGWRNIRSCMQRCWTENTAELASWLCFAAALRASPPGKGELALRHVTTQSLPTLALIIQLGGPGLGSLRLEFGVDEDMSWPVPPVMDVLTAATELHRVEVGCSGQWCNQAVRWWMSVLSTYRPPALKTLDLDLGHSRKRCDPLDDYPRGLETLILRQADRQLGTGLEHVLVRCCASSLRALEVRYLEQPADAGYRDFRIEIERGMETLLEGLPVLRHLTIDGYGKQVDEHVWRAVGRLDRLEQLVLVRLECAEGSEPALAGMLHRGMRSLGFLTLSHSFLSDGLPTVFSSAASLPNLRTLIVSDSWITSIRWTERALDGLCEVISGGRLSALHLRTKVDLPSAPVRLGAALRAHLSASLEVFELNTDVRKGCECYDGLVDGLRACCRLRSLTLQSYGVGLHGDDEFPHDQEASIQRSLRKRDAAFAALVARLDHLLDLEEINTGMVTYLFAPSCLKKPAAQLEERSFPLLRAAGRRHDMLRRRDAAAWGVVAEGFRRWQERRVCKAHGASQDTELERDEMSLPTVLPLLPAVVFRIIGTFLEPPQIILHVL
jgi:hypothetical protein